MRKIITILAPLFIFSTVTAKANEVGMGVTGALHMFDGSGTETTRQSSQKNTGSHSDEVLVPEIFVESISDTGLTVGLSYIPTRNMGSQSRKDTNTRGDTGTYKAEAELKNVFQIYTDIPLPVDYPMHLKLGVQHVTLATLESLNSGSTYPDKDLLGLTIGLGTKGDLAYGNNLYYKLEATYTEFDSYSAHAESSKGNLIEADFDDTALKASIGYKF